MAEWLHCADSFNVMSLDALRHRAYHLRTFAAGPSPEYWQPRSLRPAAQAMASKNSTRLRQIASPPQKFATRSTTTAMVLLTTILPDVAFATRT